MISASQDAHEVGGHGQQRQNQHAGQDSGDHQVFHGVDGGHREGVELVGNPHGTQLGAHAGAAPGRHHDAGHQRAQFPEKRHGHAGGDVVGGPEPTQHLEALHGQDQPHRKRGHHHEGEGFHPQLVHLVDNLPNEPGGVEQAAARIQPKEEQVPHVIDESHRLMAGPIKQALFHQPRPMQPSRTPKIGLEQPDLRHLALGYNVLKLPKNQACVKEKAQAAAPYAAATLGSEIKSQFRITMLSLLLLNIRNWHILR